MYTNLGKGIWCFIDFLFDTSSKNLRGTKNANTNKCIHLKGNGTISNKEEE